MKKLFEISFEPVTVEVKDSELQEYKWSRQGEFIIKFKDEEASQIRICLKEGMLQFFINDLFLFEEGEWSAQDFPDREWFVELASKELAKLLKITDSELNVLEIRRKIETCQKIGMSQR
jgi:hypothetical protein